MFPSPLANAWSLDSVPGGSPVFAKAPSPNNPAEFNNWFITNLLFKRWAIHTLAAALSNLPPTETQLQKASMEPFYEHVSSLITIMKKVADTRRIELPTFTDVAADWRHEAELSSSIVREELVPYLAPPMTNVIDFRITLEQTRGQYHWTTFLALISVGVPIYWETVIKSANAAGMGADETLVPYMDKLEDERVVQYMQVMSEEIARLRDNAEGTGWREEEAKSIVLKNRKIWEGSLGRA